MEKLTIIHAIVKDLNDGSIERPRKRWTNAQRFERVLEDKRSTGYQCHINK